MLSYILLWMQKYKLLSQETGWEDCLRNDLFCVGWNVKP